MKKLTIKAKSSICMNVLKKDYGDINFIKKKILKIAGLDVQWTKESVSFVVVNDAMQSILKPEHFFNSIKKSMSEQGATEGIDYILEIE